jgi:hypothetical protein
VLVVVLQLMAETEGKHMVSTCWRFAWRLLAESFNPVPSRPVPVLSLEVGRRFFSSLMSSSLRARARRVTGQVA